MDSVAASNVPAREQVFCHASIGVTSAPFPHIVDSPVARRAPDPPVTNSVRSPISGRHVLGFPSSTDRSVSWRAIALIVAQQAVLMAIYAWATWLSWRFTGWDTGVPWLNPSAGLGVAALALGGLRAWPAIFIGCAIGHSWGPPVGGTSPLALALMDGAESMLAAELLRRWPGFRTGLLRLGDGFAVVVAVGVAAVAGALLGTLAVILFGTPPWATPWRAFLTWMVGDGMGVLLVAPPILAWSRYRWSAMPPPGRLIEIGGLLIALAAAGIVSYFASVRGDIHSPLEFMPFPVAIWAAMRFGVRGATAATLLMSAVALGGHLLVGPPGAAAPSERETLLIQASLAFGALTALLVGAVTTERDETMRALGESEQRARALFAQAPDAIFILDGERPDTGRVLAANPAAADLHGVHPAELVGRHVLDFETESSPDTTLRALDQLSEGDRLRVEIAYVRQDGSAVDVEMHASAFDVGGRRYLLAFDRDVTTRRHAEAERKRMEEKLQETQKLESLGLLAGGIAHDFNNLLTGILGNANLARGQSPGFDIEPYLEQIERSAERAADLCGQMLAYAGKGRFEVTRVNLSELVHETTSLIRTSVGRNVSLDLSLTHDLPLVEADLTQIRQIIMNLVLNASEAIEDRPGAIRIRTGAVQVERPELQRMHLAADLEPGRYVYLEVSDTGRGMSAETLNRIFDPFFSTKFTGRGLGLAAVLGIVRSHKGALKVESREGTGSRFRLLLPPAASQARPILAPRASTPMWRGCGIALVIDDEPSVRHVAQRMLTAMGFEVVTASSGQEGLSHFTERPDAFAIVLLDLTMPGMRGDETYRHLRGIKAGLPIVVMSGYSHQEASAYFDAQILAGFLQKPFKLERLREVVRDALGDRSEEMATTRTGGTV
jgi:PAS domain S-box-containing protein